MAPNGPPTFDQLFEGLPASYREVALALRTVIRAEGPRLREVVKWNNPFWVGAKDVFCLQCYPEHVNLGVMQGATLAERFPQIQGTGKAMRNIKVSSSREAQSSKVRSVIRAALGLDAQFGSPK